VTVRRTSAESFEAIRASGRLSRMRWRVYSFLYEHGPLTGHELDDRMAVPGETMTSYHKRLSELERAGLVETIGERRCTVTGMTSLVWSTTDAREVQPFTRPNGKRAPEVAALEARITNLELRLRALDGRLV
jgi:DNA-binding MarR family transcriptional regulator